MTLRPYQGKGYANIFEAWKIHRILMFVLATGGGKTVLFTEVVKNFLMRGLSAMIIAHRTELIEQTAKKLYENKIFSGIIKGDHPTNYSLPCQVASIQTLIRRKDLPKADVIIIDEGHHITDDNSYKQIISMYPTALILIVTATPYRLSGQGFRKIIAGTDTKLILNSTLRTLIEDGWLVPLKYFVASIPDLTDARISKGDYNEEDTEKAMEMAPIVDSYLEHCPGKRGVSYAVNVNASKRTVSKYLSAGVPAEHIDAKTPAEERDRIITDFKADLIKVVSNVGILTEGTDFPGMDFVQLGRPTKSLSLFLQMCGRVTRPEAGVVDRYATAEERRAAIAASSKPHGLILDNAGLWIDHGLPDDEHDWEMHFNGTRKDKKQEIEDMEIMVFVYEDEQGTRKATTKVEEVEGFKLIEVTHARRRKMVNIKSLHEFDKMYKDFCRMPKVNRPGYTTITKFIEYCRKGNILMVPPMWDYIEFQLIHKHREKEAEIRKTAADNPGTYPSHVVENMVKEIQQRSISRKYFAETRTTYTQQNADELASYMAAHVPTSNN